MNYQRYIKAIVYTTVLAWTILLYTEGQALHSSFLKPLSAATTGVIWLALAFDLYLWKLSIFRPLVKRPIVEGTWKVQIQSNWIDPATKQPIGPITAYMVVRQTLSTLSMRLLTAESTSTLVGTELVCAPDGLYCISGVYRNEPWFQFRGRSEIHYGGLWLQIAEDDFTKTMTGHYWTDRSTSGSMLLTDRVTKKAQSFAAAAAAAVSKP
jgi:hypothetical protein